MSKKCDTCHHFKVCEHFNNLKGGICMHYIDANVVDIRIKEEAWVQAQEHLFDAIVRCVECGYDSRVTFHLVPLKKRYDAGERTYQLYDEIMSY